MSRLGVMLLAGLMLLGCRNNQAPPSGVNPFHTRLPPPSMNSPAMPATAPAAQPYYSSPQDGAVQGGVDPASTVPGNTAPPYQSSPQTNPLYESLQRPDSSAAPREDSQDAVSHSAVESAGWESTESKSTSSGDDHPNGAALGRRAMKKTGSEIEEDKASSEIKVRPIQTFRAPVSRAEEVTVPRNLYSTEDVVEIAELPAASKRTGKYYDFDPRHRWLQGKLEYSRFKQRWTLRYIPIDGATDAFGGSVILRDSALLKDFQSGDFARVQGRLDRQPTGTPGYAPYYHIDRIRPAP
ncbi:MAG: hypothetical protein N2C14_10905 [Planctomycetales bacterium]